MLNRPSKFDLHNDIMSNFVSLTSYFLIRTLQDDLRAVQIELKGFESCLNVSVTECGHSLLPWTCTLDFYPNLAFFLNGPLVTWTSWQHLLPLSLTCCSMPSTKDSCWCVLIGSVNWPRRWAVRVSSR